MEWSLLAGEPQMAAAVHVSLLMSVALVASARPATAADPEAEHLAAAAIALCERADRLDVDERPALLHRALDLAERAVARDDTVARAHFAVFCALGKLVDHEGLGWRVRSAIERAVALAPDDVDALVGKGALLLRLPRLLGGDREAAERVLRRAVELDPWHAGARRYLAELRGEGVPVAPTPVSAGANTGLDQASPPSR
jgi:Flp pilus assembly protein TadD